jgi:hypothetical protein
MTIRKSNWNTYATHGYTHDVANDQASAGGVHLYQVRLTDRGWQTRICQSNGKHQAYSEATLISDQDGEAHYATVVHEERQFAATRSRLAAARA